MTKQLKVGDRVTPKRGHKTLGGWSGVGTICGLEDQAPFDGLVAVRPDDEDEIKRFLAGELRRLR